MLNYIISRFWANTSVTGNHVGNVPDWMNKTGLTFQRKHLTTTFQYSYTSLSLNDSFNTTASADGVTGLIPTYRVWDWSVTWQVAKSYLFSGSINNFSN